MPGAKRYKIKLVDLSTNKEVKIPLNETTELKWSIKNLKENVKYSVYVTAVGSSPDITSDPAVETIKIKK